jgi:hypothetical protein
MMLIETKKNRENCFESHGNCSYLQKKRMNGNISGARRYHQKSKFFFVGGT